MSLRCLMKGGEALIRTVLVTEVRNKHSGEEKKIIGRYDSVALFNQGYEVVDAYKAQYEMSDNDFVRYGRFKRKES